MLLPRLANFQIPDVRQAEQLWHGDRELLLAWQRGERECLVYVATSKGQDQTDGSLYGACIVTLRKELLSGEPSAHLEVLVLSAEAEGHGIGFALLQQAEQAARDAGAINMSLHVFANNTRARQLYENAGFDGELLRYFKPL